MKQANLSERDHALYGKLDVSCEDISIARMCASYIAKKKWHTHPYMRRGSISIQQISFTTTMIVAYARPFTPGRGNIELPSRLKRYRPEQTKFHNRLMLLRNKEYAHTDDETYKVVVVMDSLIRSYKNIRGVSFSPQEIDVFMEMTNDLLGRIRLRMEEVRTGKQACGEETRKGL